MYMFQVLFKITDGELVYVVGTLKHLYLVLNFRDTVIIETIVYVM